MPDNEIEAFPNCLEWEQALNERRLVPANPAVYAIVSNKKFGRLNSKSNVLYVGKAKCLGGESDGSRLYGYRYQKSESRDGRVRENAQKATNLGHNLFLRWLNLPSEEEAKLRESELLQKYIEHHLEVPPLNSNQT